MEKGIDVFLDENITVLDIDPLNSGLTHEDLYQWKYNSTYLMKRISLKLNELKDYLLKHKEIIPQSDDIIQKIQWIITFGNKLDKDCLELIELESKKRLFLRIRNYKSLFSKFQANKRLWLESISNLRVKLEELKKWVQEDYTRSTIEAEKGLRVEDSSDWFYLRKIRSEGFLESEDYSKLRKFVFPLIPNEKPVKASIVYSVLTQLKDKRQNKIYWTNVIKFLRWYYPGPIYDRLNPQVAPHTYVSISACLNEEEIPYFFDVELFIIIEDIYPRTGRYELPVISWIKRVLDLNRDKGFNNNNRKMIEVSRRIAATNISFEFKIYHEWPMVLTSMTPGMVDMLVVFDIRKIYNLHELNILMNLKQIFLKQSDFKNVMSKLANYWKLIVDPDLRNVYYFSIFINFYYVLGNEFLDRIKNMRIVLSSVNMQEIASLMKNNPEFHMFREFPDALIAHLIRPIKRKLILMTLPKEDHNLAFQNLYNELELFPREIYTVYFYYVNHPYHLSELIRKVSKDKKIDLFMFGAHGSTGAAGYLNKDTIKLSCFDGISSCFENNATGYLFSCSTGRGDDPIAEYISQRFRIRIIAPDQDTAPYIKISKEGEIFITYGEDVKAKMFIPK